MAGTGERNLVMQIQYTEVETLGDAIRRLKQTSRHLQARSEQVFGIGSESASRDPLTSHSSQESA